MHNLFDDYYRVVETETPFLSARLVPLTFVSQQMSLFIAIRIFRIQKDVGAQKAAVALVSCVYAYFLDLILFLAQVIMSCVRRTFPTQLEFGPQWHPLSPSPAHQVLYTWGPASGCSVLFRLQSYFMRVDFAGILAVIWFMFIVLPAFCRVPCAFIHLDIIKKGNQHKVER